MNSSASNRLRANCRSERNGEMKDTSTIESRIDHQPGDLGHAADVLRSIRLGEPEVAVEAVADVVAVEQVGVASGGEQPPLEVVGDRRLARSRTVR